MGERADVVDDVRTGRERRPHRRRVARVDRDESASPGRRRPEPLDHRHHPRESPPSTSTGRAPGRVDSPPTSTIPAPAAIIALPWAAARSGSRSRPPSEKLSGVALTIPMTTGSGPGGPRPRGQEEAVDCRPPRGRRKRLGVTPQRGGRRHRRAPPHASVRVRSIELGEREVAPRQRQREAAGDGGPGILPRQQPKRPKIALHSGVAVASGGQGLRSDRQATRRYPDAASAARMSRIGRSTKARSASRGWGQHEIVGRRRDHPVVIDDVQIERPRARSGGPGTRPSVLRSPSALPASLWTARQFQSMPRR